MSTNQINFSSCIINGLKCSALSQFYIFIAKERHKNGYVEQKLNKALSDKLRDLDDKIENAEHSRSFFGEEMYKKLVEIDEKRGEALLFDRGKVGYFMEYCLAVP